MMYWYTPHKPILKTSSYMKEIRYKSYILWDSIYMNIQNRKIHRGRKWNSDYEYTGNLWIVYFKWVNCMGSLMIVIYSCRHLCYIRYCNNKHSHRSKKQILSESRLNWQVCKRHRVKITKEQDSLPPEKLIRKGNINILQKSRVCLWGKRTVNSSWNLSC